MKVVAHGLPCSSSAFLPVRMLGWGYHVEDDRPFAGQSRLLRRKCLLSCIQCTRQNLMGHCFHQVVVVSIESPITHRIHVWYANIWGILMVNVTIYIPYMDPIRNNWLFRHGFICFISLDAFAVGCCWPRFIQVTRSAFPVLQWMSLAWNQIGGCDECEKRSTAYFWNKLHWRGGVFFGDLCFSDCFRIKISWFPQMSFFSKLHHYLELVCNGLLRAKVCENIHHASSRIIKHHQASSRQLTRCCQEW